MCGRLTVAPKRPSQDEVCAPRVSSHWPVAGERPRRRGVQSGPPRSGCGRSGRLRRCPSLLRWRGSGRRCRCRVRFGRPAFVCWQREACLRHISGRSSLRRGFAAPTIPDARTVPQVPRSRPMTRVPSPLRKYERPSTTKLDVRVGGATLGEPEGSTYMLTGFVN